MVTLPLTKLLGVRREQARKVVGADQRHPFISLPPRPLRSRVEPPVAQVQTDVLFFKDETYRDARVGEREEGDTGVKSRQELKVYVSGRTDD